MMVQTAPRPRECRGAVPTSISMGSGHREGALEQSREGGSQPELAGQAMSAALQPWQCKASERGLQGSPAAVTDSHVAVADCRPLATSLSGSGHLTDHMPLGAQPTLPRGLAAPPSPPFARALFLSQP